MNIRSLTESDAEAFRALRLRGLLEHPEAFGSAYEDEKELALDWWAERLRNSTDDNLTFGAFLDGQLIGCLGMGRSGHRKSRHRASIWGMYVISEAQGQGAGRALLAALITHAEQQPGLEDLVLAVTVTNEAAKYLYLSAGFTVWGRDPRYLKIDGVYYDLEWMVKRLVTD